MSAGLPYLKGLRKSDLSDIAVKTELSDYSGLKKGELETALDDHLRANQTTYARDPSLNDYYRRLGAVTKSPVKRIAEKVSDMVKSDDDAPAPIKKVRRKTTSPTEETDTDAATSSSALVKTPAKEVARRASILTSSIPLPPSPAVVTDAIDQQTRRIRNSISHAYDRTQIHEASDYVRDLLSSPLTIQVVAVLIEGYTLRQKILPDKKFTEIPAIPFIKSTPTVVNVPDLFQLPTGDFWGPFTLWLLTSFLLPGMISYFINLPLKAHPSHNYNTRRAATEANMQMTLDPFIFSLAKGLIAYVVYAQHFQFGGLVSNWTIATVNEAVLGEWPAMLAGSGIGAAVSLYDAILKK